MTTKENYMYGYFGDDLGWKPEKQPLNLMDLVAKHNAVQPLSPYHNPTRLLSSHDKEVDNLKKMMEKWPVQEVRDIQVGGDHYKGKAMQPWDIIDAWELNFYAGNVLKYLLRYKHKDGLQDLKKAKHYLDKLIEDYENSQ